ADRVGLSTAAAVGDRARPGESLDPGFRRQKGRSCHVAAARGAGRQRVCPAKADGIRGSRGAVVVARLCPHDALTVLSHVRLPMLPEAKLDILLAHHASLENELLGQVNSEKYVQITRELSELNPLIDAVKAYRSTQAELAGTEQLIADPATDSEMRGMAEAERDELQV